MLRITGDINAVLNKAVETNSLPALQEKAVTPTPASLVFGLTASMRSKHEPSPEKRGPQHCWGPLLEERP